MAGSGTIRVWDRLVRIGHWALVLSFVIAYDSTVGSQRVHEWSGYTALALVALRVVWGFIGSEHARFADFVPGPRRLWRYLRASVRREAPRYIGHNPAGAMMMVFLLCMVVAIGVSGWMLTLDAYWGSETVEDTHVLLVDITLIAIALHVTGAVYESLNHRENLVWAMVTGRKRAPSGDDVPHGAAEDAAAEPRQPGSGAITSAAPGSPAGGSTDP